jgi:hypothetical protein
VLAARFLSLEMLGGTRVIFPPLLLISPLYPKESCWEIRLGVKALHSASFGDDLIFNVSYAGGDVSYAGGDNIYWPL